MGAPGVILSNAAGGWAGSSDEKCGDWRHFSLICFFAMRLPYAILNVLALGLVLGSGVSAQCRFPGKFNSRTLTYRFRPELTGAGLVLHVLLELETDENGERTLALPTRWAGEAFSSMSNLHAVSSGALLADGADADTKVLRYPPHRRVSLEYDLRKDFPGRLVHPLQFHPVLMLEYLQITGSNAFVAPKLAPAERATVNFDWQSLPKDWILATSFGTSASQSGRCQSNTGRWIDINDGLYAAGMFRVHPFKIGRRAAVLAIRGNWPFTDDEAVAKIARVMGTVRDFWHDDKFPYFLVTMIPFDSDHGSGDGSAFTNAFWMYLSRLDPLNGVVLSQLAHETFHGWDPMKMGIIPSDADEESMKWFREGPTDYYAHLLTLMAGETSAAEYIASLNDDLRKFPVSKSEYVRGRIISLWLDATIRSESGGKHSLDDVMFDMVRDRRMPLTLERIFSTAGRYVSPASASLLRDAVTKHGDLAAPAQIPSVSFCAHPVLENLATFDLGLDLTHSAASGRITGVIPDSPAYMAGLRDGQSLHGHLSVNNGDPDRLAIFTIRTEAGDKEIQFYPRGKSIPVWQYHVNQCQPSP